MTETVAIIVPTYGDVDEWRPLAYRALYSAQNQSHPPSDVRWVHADTLQWARNEGAERAYTDWLIFLDADDELDPYYIEKMLEGEGEVRQPATLGVHADGTVDKEANVIPPGEGRMYGAPLLERNHIVIGAMISKSLFDEVGGFNDLPCLEDWDLWIRCWLEGATFGVCPEAIYRVHFSDESRNNPKNHGEVFTQIRQKYTRIAQERGLI